MNHLCVLPPEIDVRAENPAAPPPGEPFVKPLLSIIRILLKTAARVRRDYPFCSPPYADSSLFWIFAYKQSRYHYEQAIGEVQPARSPGIHGMTAL
jgi:hypothetical protein